ncbi:MAG: TPM domain-containing protein [Ramlibacter sp.]|nr:TPM domain-containing protein [Ramlibacter sp.]
MKRALVFLLALWAFCALGQNLQPVPPLTARVIDQTGTLDAIQRQGLEDKLAAFEASKGTQIAFLIVATTQPEDIASYANRVGNEWKIGRRDIGDGVLLVVAKNDRKVRIEVAKTLEGAIPDLAAKLIIDEAITPSFRQGDFAGGLQAAADRIIARASGEALPAPEQPAQRGGDEGFDWMDLAIFLFIGVPVAARALSGILGRKLGALATGAGVGTIALLVTASIAIAAIAALVALLLSLGSGALPALGGHRRGGWGGGPWIGGGGSGGGSWGSGGGGWSGGGGGDFGGGGASGDW